ncbi:hypothetical protein V6N13_059065 [Hibiscus sabdariffa]|uniref:Uncharacterized protein n=1 Tax=Hibiscus sabdariffa TaxID=183260 RepID=A0ABR2GEB1_9ROSI
MLAPLGRVQVLERPASPTELVSQRAAKKGKSDLDHTEGMEFESEAVEVLSAGVTDRAVDPIVMEKTGGVVVNGADKVSYAAMAAESVSSIDECMIGKEPMNESNENVGGMGPRVDADGSQPELYGPWMMAANCRRRSGRVEATNYGMRRTTEVVSGSCFSVLNERNGEGELPNEDDLEREAIVAIREDVERPYQRIYADGKGMVQDRGVRLNKSYLESNLSRRPRAKESAASGSNDDVAKTSNRQREELSLSKLYGKENMSLRIKKGHGFQAPSRAALRDWIPNVSRMIDDDAQNMRHGLEHEFEVIDDEDPKETNSEVEVAVQNLIPGGRSSAVGMDLGPSQ